MAYNRGKEFEKQFKQDWLKLPNSFALRLPDQMSGMYGSRNLCDFICYNYPRMYLIECKSCEGNTFPFSSFGQYDKLRAVGHIKGIEIGVVVWFVNHKKVLFIPIDTFNTIKDEDGKSFNIKMVGNPKYKCLEIPSIEKRVFLESDYTPLLSYDLKESING